MSTPIQQALILIITFFFYLINTLLLVRIMLQMSRANYFNPVVKMITQLTDPLILPLRKVIPRVNMIDTSCILLLFIFSYIKLLLIILVQAGILPNLVGLIVLTIPDIIGVIIEIMFWAILLVVLMSWVPALANSPVADIIIRLTDPLLRPAKRLIPSISGFDFSPIIVILLLRLTTILLVEPLTRYALQLL